MKLSNIFLFSYFFEAIECNHFFPIGEMSEEQQKRSIGIIFHKIDADRDKEITGEELVAWLTKIEENFRRKTALEHLKIYDLDGDNMVSDDEFRTHLEFEDKKNAEFLQRQWRKFGTADFDGNKKLAIKEFTAFLFPQYFEGTKGEWMQDRLLIYDLNKDGKISFEEFIKFKEFKDENEEKKKTFQFNRHDQDGNGILESDEVRDFFHPNSEHIHVTHAIQLMDELDKNMNGVLSRSELVDKFHKVANSKITDHGQIHHDEL